MSLFLPAAPPLPTKFISDNIEYSIRVKYTTPTKIKIEDCKWAQNYPDLQKACYMARICEPEKPIMCHYRIIPSILQEGPTCGLTAVSMLLQGFPPAHELFFTAKAQRYTNNGEIFSANNLYNILCDELKLRKEKLMATSKEKIDAEISCELYKGRLNCAKIRDCLISGACLLVPYDTDYNHAPCIKFGHRAHWALVIGYLVTAEKKFYVIARHGKTLNLATWCLESLSESNANLIEFAPPKTYPYEDFVLPVGGIGGNFGLKERAIIVKGLSYPVTNIH